MEFTLKTYREAHKLAIRKTRKALKQYEDFPIPAYKKEALKWRNIGRRIIIRLEREYKD